VRKALKTKINNLAEQSVSGNIYSAMRISPPPPRA